MRKLREVLRDEYIGAIAIGFLLAQTIGVFINSVVRPVQFFMFDRDQRSIFGGGQHLGFPWSSLLVSLITILLYAASAFILFYWLYMPAHATNESSEESTVAADLFE